MKNNAARGAFEEIVAVPVKDAERPEKNPIFPNKPVLPDSHEKGRRQWLTKTILSIIILFSIAFESLAQQAMLELSGPWTYQLDSLDAGEKNGWNARLFSQQLPLPGTLDDAGIGTPNDLSLRLEKSTLLQLTRKHHYTGAVWYSREVNIPENWKTKNITLQLERVIWETQVWVDGKKCGMNESIVAPHAFDLTNSLSPGKHIISIRIDNREKYDVSHSTRNLAHAYTDGTQIIWNGVIGKMRLVARENIFIDETQVYPDFDAGTVTTVVTLKNASGSKASGELTVQVSGLPAVVTQPFAFTGDRATITAQYVLGKDFKAWDEFDPHLYTLSLKIAAGKGKKKTADERTVTFGMRKLGREKNVLLLNNHRIFLRGTLECAIFPLTGYPPMDVPGWKKIFETARSYGLNHLRFHSWCPPEAAFQAADENGFYLQIELPLWSPTAGKDDRINTFLKEEAYRIIRYYGNHPSFCFWSMGNELEGNFDWIKGLLTELRKADQRHLYTTTTFTFQKGKGLWPEPVDDFYITQYTKKGWVRGQGIFDTDLPSFDKDYRAAADSMPVPLISHEIGQYSIYPDLKEIEKYTGVLSPLNFKAIRQDLQQKSLLDQAPSFTKASGKFAVELYKEEIERALKTPGFSGFQLLDLHDFPGQGTALVGVLDAFWESKGLITPEAFRQFCSPVVPLARYSKAVYTNAETFDASFEIANFGQQALKNAAPTWTIKGSDGKTLASGKLKTTDIPVGNGFDLGSIRYGLSAIHEATALTLEVALEGTVYKNSWKIWVYPAQLATTPGDVIITQSLSEALGHLSKGKNVLLNPPLNSIQGIEGKFVPVFWSPVHFPDQPGSMGLLCSPTHPALKYFPTEDHSDWQWWRLCKTSKPMLLDGFASVKPIIQVIDNFFKNRRMGDLVEVKAGKGKLMICSIDLSDSATQHPEARQLLYSILHYMNSSEFNPSVTVTESDLAKLIKPVVPKAAN